MGRRSSRMNAESLCRFLTYVLGHRPDEFGLVPSGEGRVPVKELLQALHEEDGWRHVRQAHINEILMGCGRGLFDLVEGGISAEDRHYSSPAEARPGTLPKLLYTAVRARAHPVAAEKGLIAPEGRWLVLTGSETMAHRMGRRKDQEPVVLEIGTAQAQRRGVLFFSFGELFLSASLPPECIMGPQVRQQDGERKEKAQKEKPGARKRPDDFTPGSFTFTSERDPDRLRKAKGKKPRSWKEKARAKRRKGDRT